MFNKYLKKQGEKKPPSWAVDAGCFLWYRSGRDRDNIHGHLQTFKENLGQRLALMVDIRRSRYNTFIFEKEIIWLILAGGLLYWFYKTKQKLHPLNCYFLFPFLLQAAIQINNDHSLLKQIGWYFFKAGAFVFGSGLAIIPFLYRGVVKEYAWLNEQQFLDAVTVAMITPGPVVITVGFIGYLVAGVPGACVASLATFLPCYLFTVLPAPYFKKWGKHPGIKAVVDVITAAAVGAIAGAVFVLAKRKISDFVSAAIALVTVVILFQFNKIREPYIIIVAVVIGLLLKYSF